MLLLENNYFFYNKIPQYSKLMSNYNTNIPRVDFQINTGFKN